MAEILLLWGLYTRIIPVKYTHTRVTGLSKSLSGNNGVRVKIVVSLDYITLPSKGGIKHVQVWKLNELL